MRGARFIVVSVLIGSLFALTLPAAADGPPVPPQSQETNPNPVDGEGNPVAIDPAGSLVPVEAAIPVPPPPRLSPAEVLAAPGAPAFEGLPVPMRYQDKGDVSCGVQALGMALDGLGGAPPRSEALIAFLQGKGMLYDFGTGVEELAHAAQAFGYGGSVPFHGGSLDLLKGQLGAGHPVVVALGTGGEGEPGHFVTLTGISPDGEWVSYNDPALGERVISMEDFLRLWDLQGNSGVVVAETPPAEAGGIDPAPWVAVAATLMAILSQTPRVRLRKGVGGALAEGWTVEAPAPGRKKAKKKRRKAKPKPKVMEESKLTKLEELLDPVIPPEPTREERKLGEILGEEPVFGGDNGALATPEVHSPRDDADHGLAGYNLGPWPSAPQDPESLSSGCSSAEVFVGDPPWEEGEQGLPGEAVPGALGALSGVMTLFNTFAAPYAYADYLENAEPNVAGHVTYSYYKKGTKIWDVTIFNHSGTPLKVSAVVETSKGRRFTSSPTWCVEPILQFRLPDLEPGCEGQEQCGLLGPDESAAVTIILVATMLRRPLIRQLLIDIPSADMAVGDNG